MNDYRRVPSTSGALTHPGHDNRAGGQGFVRPSLLGQRGGGVILAPPSGHVDVAPPKSRPDLGASHRDDVPTYAVSWRGGRKTRRTPRVAILGCGPSGLLASHAVNMFGTIPTIFSVRQKSDLPGGMYLHERIPYLTNALLSSMINFRKIGTRDGYAAKVYGDHTAPCSWDQFEDRSYIGYSLHQVYNDLWSKYSHLIQDVMLDNENVDELTQDFEIVLCTVPAPSLCRLRDAHEFLHRDVYIWKGNPIEIPNNEIWYNGNNKTFWYRTSRVFGYCATETTDELVALDPDESGVWKHGVKPMTNDCNCHSRFHRLGRYGKWQKGVLTHHAFYDTLEIMRRAGTGALL